MLRAMAERLVYASIPVNVNSLNCIVIGAGAIGGSAASLARPTRREPWSVATVADSNITLFARSYNTPIRHPQIPSASQARQRSTGPLMLDHNLPKELAGLIISKGVYGFLKREHPVDNGF